MAEKTITLRVGGMTCANCQKKIAKKLRATRGVSKATVSLGERSAVVTFDPGTVSERDIVSVIEALDYTVLPDGKGRFDATRIVGLLVAVVALYAVLEWFGVLNMLAPTRLADETVGYGMLFVIGLVTSVHCVAMCGGINISQCMPQGVAVGETRHGDGAVVETQSVGVADGKMQSLGVEDGKMRSGGSRFSVAIPSLLYNLGRLASYTAVGFAVGAIGSAIALTPAMQGILKLIAGVFMLVMGVNMLGIFPPLRKLTAMIARPFSRLFSGIGSERSNGDAQSKSPLIVGLLNGFMPCGPLQAMQIYALSTGSAFAGALAMFLFAAGTLPLMFGLGALSSALGRRFTGKAMTVGAVLVVVLGLSMLTQGWSLTGFADGAFGNTPSVSGEPNTTDDSSISGGAGATGDPTESPDATSGEKVQIVNSTLSPRGYPAITVEVGTPVRWIIDAPRNSITGCNNRLYISEYGIEHSFTLGENIIEFMPEKTGKFQYACWMGMLRSTITVVEAGA
jgi:sulfite exporter TauE/SafE/copper chaperone CopZ